MYKNQYFESCNVKLRHPSATATTNLFSRIRRLTLRLRGVGGTPTLVLRGKVRKKALVNNHSRNTNDFNFIDSLKTHD